MLTYRTYLTVTSRPSGKLINKQIARFITKDGWLCRIIDVKSGKTLRQWPVFNQEIGEKLEAKAKEWAK